MVISGHGLLPLKVMGARKINGLGTFSVLILLGAVVLLVG